MAGLGKKEEKSVVLEVMGSLRNRLAEFQRLMERMWANTESVRQLAPDVENERKRIENGIGPKEEETKGMIKLMPKCEREKQKLEEELSQTGHKMSEIGDRMVHFTGTDRSKERYMSLWR